jgi:hypothetical protein
MYIFNPDNDLALANFRASYTPPASAAKMADDLAVLPLWYAPNGSKIVVEGDENKAFIESVKTVFQIDATAISFSETGNFPNEKIVPWGWNPALRKKLMDTNVSEKNLPTLDELKRLRDYSGRQYAVKMLRELKLENEMFCGESHYFVFIDDILRFLASQSGNSVLKMPNSGSGKGLIWILGEITDKQTDWAKRVLRTQKGVVAEPFIEKVRDFAMEFYMESGNVRFVGYSLFRSAASGAYMGNMLMSDEGIEKELSKFVSTHTLHQINKLLQQKLSRFFPFYNGYAGVDMMICETPTGYRVQPCVEINMRMNMGLVAHTFRKRFVAQGVSGRYMVDFFKKPSETFAFHRKMQTDFPPIIENGRIEKGYFALTPVNEGSNYLVYVVVEARHNS